MVREENAPMEEKTIYPKNLTRSFSKTSPEDKFSVLKVNLSDENSKLNLFFQKSSR